jgi:hypothetical protein
VTGGVRVGRTGAIVAPSKESGGSGAVGIVPSGGAETDAVEEFASDIAVVALDAAAGIIVVVVIVAVVAASGTDVDFEVLTTVLSGAGV